MQTDLPKYFDGYYPSSGLYLVRIKLAGKTYERLHESIPAGEAWIANLRKSVDLERQKGKQVCQACRESKNKSLFIRLGGKTPRPICNDCHEASRAERQRVRRANLEHKWKALKKRAKARGLTCDLSLEKYVELKLATHCECCGAAFTGEVVVHIDRADNDAGYSDENCHALCFRCNTLKGAASLYDLKKMLDYMSN